MRSSTRRVALAAATTAALAAIAPATASADAFCSFDYPVKISPGLSATPAPFTFTSGGETGTVTCHGDVGGKMITGPGTVGITGASTGPASCANGQGSADVTYTLPTAGGPVASKYHITFSYLLGAGAFMSPDYSGGFGFLPTKGNCFTEPVTEAAVMGFSHITSTKSGGTYKRPSRRHRRK
jgi:hypothetical protein